MSDEEGAPLTRWHGEETWDGKFEEKKRMRDTTGCSRRPGKQSRVEIDEFLDSFLHSLTHSVKLTMNPIVSFSVATSSSFPKIYLEREKDSFCAWTDCLDLWVSQEVRKESYWRSKVIIIINSVINGSSDCLLHQLITLSLSSTSFSLSHSPLSILSISSLTSCLFVSWTFPAFLLFLHYLRY